MAAPIILANLAQPMLAAADVAVAGHLGAAANLGGVAQGGLLLGFVFWSFGFLRMGTTGLVAQAVGAGDEATVRAHLLRGLALALALGLLLAAIAPLLLTPALHALGGSPDVRFDARVYCLARLVAAPAALGNYVVLGYLLGMRKVRGALVLQAGINAVNLVGLFIAIGVLHGGVAGIGAATACADLFGFVAGVVWLRRDFTRRRGAEPITEDSARQTRHARYEAIRDRTAWRRLFGVNRDIFIRTLFLLAALAAFSRNSARLGETVLAANAVLQVFGNLTSFALDGFAQAAEALVGAAVGRRDRAAFVATLRACAYFTVIGAGVFALIYLLCGNWLIARLTALPEVASTAREMLPWAILLPLASCGGFLLDGVFIGTTRTRPLMHAMVVATLCFAMTLWLLRGWGNNGLWCALSLFMFVRGIALTLWLPALMRDCLPGPARS